DQSVLHLDRVDAQGPVRSMMTDEVEYLSQIIGSAWGQSRVWVVRRPEANQTFHRGQSLEARVFSIGFGICGRLPAGFDGIVAHSQEMVGSVPRIGGEGPAIPVMVGFGHERAVLCDADGTVGGRSCSPQPGLQDAEETERAGDDGRAGGVCGVGAASAAVGLPWGSVKGPPELDPHPCSSLPN